jgi:hypothetical protein
MNANTLMLVGGVTAFILTLHQVRAKVLQEKYALGWLGLALFVLAVGIAPEWLYRFTVWARLANASAVLFVALTIIFLFSFSVSISLTDLNRRNLRLLQELALLEARVRELEGKPPKETPE